ncbi:MAG: hypothetical protein CMI84_00190 [Candidatus Pelagibacter sp.]|nr:hypothetical protein [Candidatus Pelagibacter sp.]|tara:strand:+ start:85 stop:411 length:327 start_codon:yes stop_codon:yes gene_type:complete
MKQFFLSIIFLLVTTNLTFAEFKLVPTNCTKKKLENCGAYLYNNQTGTTYFCNSEKCVEIQEALAEFSSEEVSGKTGEKKSKKSKIPKFGDKKKKKKKSKIPKFKKSE